MSELASKLQAVANDGSALSLLVAHGLLPAIADLVEAAETVVDEVNAGEVVLRDYIRGMRRRLEALAQAVKEVE